MYRILLGATALSLAGIAAADVPPARTAPPVVGFIDGAKSYCWARAYTADHMTSHPRQKVSSIAFVYTPRLTVDGETHNQWDQYSEAATLYMNVIVRIAGDSRTFLGSGGCTAASPTLLKCFIDGDAGTFSLKQQKDGGVLLENPTSIGVSVIPAKATDGPAEDGIMVEAKDDHQSFAMPKATGGLCDVEWPGVTRR